MLNYLKVLHKIIISTGLNNFHKLEMLFARQHDYSIFLNFPEWNHLNMWLYLHH